MRKFPFAGIELTAQRVKGYMVPLSYRGDRLIQVWYRLLIQVVVQVINISVVQVINTSGSTGYKYKWYYRLLIQVVVQVIDTSGGTGY